MYGAAAIRIERSPNRTTWATLATFTAATGCGGEQLTVTGSVDR